MQFLARGDAGVHLGAAVGVLARRTGRRGVLLQPGPGLPQGVLDLGERFVERRRHGHPPPLGCGTGGDGRLDLGGPPVTGGQQVVGAAVGGGGGGLVAAAGEDRQRRAGDLLGRHGGDPALQLVSLVDDDHVMVGQDRLVGEGVDGEQGVVGHHHIGLGRGGFRRFGEAPVTEGAAGRPDALPAGHTDLPPGLVTDTPGQTVPVPDRLPVAAVVAVAVEDVLRPVVDPPHLGPGPGEVGLVEQSGVLFRGGGLTRPATTDPVEAEVVVAALEDGETGTPPQLRRQRLGEPGQVPVDELTLQGDRRGGDHHPLPGGHRMGERGDQVGEGFTGAGARLHREMLLLADGAGDGVRHGVLVLPPRPAEGGDGVVEEVAGGGGVGHGRAAHRSTKRTARAGSSRDRARPSQGRVTSCRARYSRDSSRVG
jgi:hypothetical protein